MNVQEILADGVGTLATSLIEDKALSELKGKYLKILRDKATATETKVDDKALEVLESEAVDALIEEMKVALVKAIYRAAKDTKTPYDDMAVRVGAKYLGVSEKDYAA